jgi:hypothetical protein
MRERQRFALHPKACNEGPFSTDWVPEVKQDGYSCSAMATIGAIDIRYR